MANAYYLNLSNKIDYYAVLFRLLTEIISSSSYLILKYYKVLT